MKKKILLFRGGGRLLDFYAHVFSGALSSIGIQAIVLDVHEKPPAELYAALMKGEILCGISENFLGVRYSVDGKQTIWEQFDLKVYNLLFDHPFHFDHEWKDIPEQMTLLLMDRRHLPFLHRFYSTSVEGVFVPHAGIEAPVPHLPLKDRGITVFYAGNLSRIEASGLIPDLTSVDSYDALEACREILTRLTEEPKYTTEETIERYFKEESIELSDDQLKKEIVRLRFLESFAVSYFREQAIVRFLEAGLDVTISGRGWEETPFAGHPKLTLRGDADPGDIPFLMNQAKCVFSTQTWFKDGAHDRIFNGQLAESLVVTEETGYLRERFPEERELMFFSLGELSKLPERLTEVLSDIQKAQETAHAGFLSAVESDTWAHRFRSLLSEHHSSML